MYALREGILHPVQLRQHGMGNVNWDSLLTILWIRKYFAA